jgi:hypothetical protein
MLTWFDGKLTARNNDLAAIIICESLGTTQPIDMPLL